MTNNKPPKNIFRFENKSSSKNRTPNGWWVRIQRNGQRFSQLFSDSKYGGKDKSFEAAIRFRDIFLSQFTGNPNTATTIAGTRKLSNRNKTGIEGVYRYQRHYKKRGNKFFYDAFAASWTSKNGKQIVRRFSIKKFGEAEAFLRAVQARKEGIKKLKPPKHKAFSPPKNKDAKVWRYMDFTKFVSMLSENALFFSRIDMLNDPFEGSFSRANEEIRPLLYKSNPNTPMELSKLIKELRRFVVVNCWHVSDYESAAMWELYSKSNESICIQSSWRKLKTLLHDSAEVGFVQYVDYEKEWVPEHEPILPFLYKRRSFEHEKEIRAITNTGNIDSFNGEELPGEAPENGILIGIDLSALIEKIYISPRAPEWFYLLTKKIVKKYGLEKPIKQSSLMADPFY